MMHKRAIELRAESKLVEPVNTPLFSFRNAVLAGPSMPMVILYAYLTRTTPDPINNEYPSAAASVEKYALFGGGAVNTLTGSYTASVEAYRYIPVIYW